MLTATDLDWYACRLALAVYDTNREWMSIQGHREALEGQLRDAHTLQMIYGKNGSTEIYSTATEGPVELPAPALSTDILAAFKKKEQLSTIQSQP